MSVPKFHERPVQKVKADQPITIRLSVARAPARSASQPAGTSNIAYASANTLNTYPILTDDNPNSRIIGTAAAEIDTRSR
jgi:hypothetical protein